MAGSPRTALLVIAALFAIPVILAWLQLSGIVHLGEDTTVNRGRLVQPTIALAWPAGLSDELSGRWVLTVSAGEDCGENCREFLSGLRNLRTSLGRRQDYLALVLVDPPAGAEPVIALGGFEIVREAPEDFQAALAQAAGTADRPEGKATTKSTAAAYLVDPRGSIMMYYGPGTDPADIRADIERLLKNT
jgi:hypothetical protein